MPIKNWLYYLAICIICQSCALFGIHVKMQNPKKEGKLPDFSQETILLGEMTKFRSCFDVHYYDLSININPKEKYLSGTVQIHAIALTDFDTLQIDLYPEFEIQTLNELGDKAQLKYNRKERALFISNPHEKGDEFILEIQYSGQPPIAKKPPWKGGFVWKKDKDKNPWIGVSCESDGASIWWPLKDHTSDEPDSTRMHYTVPKGLMAVGNGQFEGVDQGDMTNTYNWFVSYPINTYNISVYVGNFSKISSTYTGNDGQALALSYYVLPQNFEKAKNHFGQVVNILSVFEKKFGKYPWYNDGFKLIESPYAGMEHQTAIAYGNGYKNDLNAKYDYILLHETAHEWWGNSVTAVDLSDVWIQEGFATYAEALFLEELDGKRAYNSHINFYKLFIKNKYPVVGITNRRWFHYKLGSDVYVKGAWVLHTLRNQLNNDVLFFDIIKSFHETYKYQVVSSKDFVQMVNSKTGSDFTCFFNQYLNTNWVPELEYKITGDGYFYYKWSKTNDDFNRLKVTIKTLKGTEEIMPSKEVQRIGIPKTPDGKLAFQIMMESLFAIVENKHLID